MVLGCLNRSDYRCKLGTSELVVGVTKDEEAFCLASGIDPIRQLMDANVRVSIGVGGSANVEDGELQTIELMPVIERHNQISAAMIH